MSMSEQFRQFRRVSTPLVAIRTVDARATIKSLGSVRINGNDSEPPIIIWDIVRGHRPGNESGVEPAQMLGDPNETANAPPLVLRKAEQLPSECILFMLNAHEFLNNAVVSQAISNLRDQFKTDRRTLVLLAPSVTLPLSLQSDVFVLDAPLPDDAELEEIVSRVHTAADVAIPDDLTAYTKALRGLSPFCAEESVAHCLKSSGLDVNGLWESKRRMIDETPGLSVHRGAERFDDLGGMVAIKTFLRRVLTGRHRPNCVVFFDEIEKALAGSNSDSSGVAQDFLGTLLGHMQDSEAAGVILLGVPGSGKSAIAKASGNEVDVPTVEIDLGAMKASLVGESESRLRNALKVIDAISDGRTLWIATCNSIESLRPELRRRFSLGVFYHDLPDADEREAIWHIYQSRFDLVGHTRPDDGNWTGAEIKQCCELAWRLNVSLIEASQYIVPLAVSAADSVDKLRSQADGKYLSASSAGVYRKSVNGSHRTITL